MFGRRVPNWDKKLHTEGAWDSSQDAKARVTASKIAEEVKKLVSEESKRIAELDTRPKNIQIGKENVFNPFVYKDLMTCVLLSLKNE